MEDVDSHLVEQPKHVEDVISNSPCHPVALLATDHLAQIWGIIIESPEERKAPHPCMPSRARRWPEFAHYGAPSPWCK
ncbi:hypothetical protein E2562_024166 [Oryza meyeriana var. granulata]|uniref:Uncharacterized protein n=1 Tax=Oryza meyeriana var. granulata TaxID=110450 RepID=A0A6G1EP94_9ORYZ|nr:hypothetical protein E2562_024166 [Oryza meyeriana var. granulata]